MDTSPTASPIAEGGRRFAGRTAAILLIHGIGEPVPYQATNAFVRGLAGELGLGPETMEHRLARQGEQSTSSIRMHLAEPLGRSGVGTLDVYEFYWAGLVEERIKLRQVLGWLARTALTPLRYWSQLATVLAPENAGAAQAPSVVWRSLLREVLRSVGLIVLAALVVFPFLYAALHARELARSGGDFLAVLRAVSDPLPLALVLLFAGIGLGILWASATYRTGLRPAGTAGAPDIEVAASRSWLRASLVAGVALLVLAGAVHAAFHLDLPGLLRHLWSVVRPWPVLAPLLATVVAVLARRFLVHFIGDIALYVTADERASFYRTRAEILEGSTTALRALLADPAYDVVYLAGHSLGSVIAYDTINRYIREVRTDPSMPGQPTTVDLNRLRGLLTFGSPLDKVYYFFRTDVGDREAVRAQILSSLHGFRKVGSGRDYGDLKLAPYRIPEPADFQWLNVFSPADPVSGYLDFYRVDVQRSRRYVAWPVGAHLRYWDDPDFYRLVAEWF